MGLTHTRDEYGKATLQSNDGLHQVAMECEKPFMEACIDRLQPHGDVLEIGFGLGHSANCIQSNGVPIHSIVECDATVLERFGEWSRGEDQVELLYEILRDHARAGTRIGLYSGRPLQFEIPGLYVDNQDFEVAIPDTCRYVRDRVWMPLPSCAQELGDAELARLRRLIEKYGKS